jgi:hypothetical protein
VVWKLTDKSVLTVLVGDCEGEAEVGVDFGEQVGELRFRYEDEWLSRRLQVPEVVAGVKVSGLGGIR